MDDQQSRLLTWMAGGLAVLIAAIVFIDPPDDEDGDDKQTWTPLHEGLDADQIAEISLTTAEGSRSLARDEAGRWSITGTGPAPIPADQDAIDELARAIAGVECGEPIADTPDAQFGLAPAKLTANLTLRDGAKIQLLAGRDAPVGWSSYAVCGTEAGVRPTRDKLSITDISFAQLRDQTIFSNSSPAVAISFAYGNADEAEFMVSRSLGGWTDQAGRRASTVKIEQLLDALTMLKPVSFDEHADQQMNLTVTVHTEDGMSALRETAAGVLLADAQPSPVKTEPRLAALVPTTIDALLAETLFTLEGIDKLTIKLDGDEYIAESQEGSGWDQVWAEQLTSARVSRANTPEEQPEQASARSGRVTASAPLGGEQQVWFTISNTQKAWFRDGEEAAWAPLPDEVGKIILSL